MIKSRRNYAKTAVSKYSKYSKKPKSTKTPFYRRMYNKSQAHIGEISVKLEADPAIQTVSGNVGYYFNNAGSPVRYLNLTQLITGSLTWTTMSPLYSKFKINSIFVQVLNTDLNGSPYNSTTSSPHFYLNFAPDKVNTDLGSAVAASDSSLIVNPVCTEQNANSKTFYFPNNYFPGPGIGLGVWNNPANISNLLGQFCLYNWPVGNATDTSVPFYLIVRINTVFDQLNK